MTTHLEELSQPPRDLGEDQRLQPIFAPGANPSLEDWHALRPTLRRRWRRFLGTPSSAIPPGDAEVIRRLEQPRFRATLFRQPTGPQSRQLVLLMEPTPAPRAPLPGAVVPFYHPDPMAGLDLERNTPIRERPLIQFGRHLVEQGYLVACVEAFPYNTVPRPENDAGFAWWQAATDKILRDNPNWTGMGKLIHDTRLATDLLFAHPRLDKQRVVIIGHSLGGKMAFYNGCLDERISAVIASDFGIGYNFTNWDAPWYLGPKIHDPALDLAHHHLLALLAPRPFFLIAGKFDKRESWQYLNAAALVYQLHGQRHALALCHHNTGHEPTAKSVATAYRWLAHRFDLPQAPYRLTQAESP